MLDESYVQWNKSLLKVTSNMARLRSVRNGSTLDHHMTLDCLFWSESRESGLYQTQLTSLSVVIHTFDVRWLCLACRVSTFDQ